MTVIAVFVFAARKRHLAKLLWTGRVYSMHRSGAFIDGKQVVQGTLDLARPDTRMGTAA